MKMKRSSIDCLERSPKRTPTREALAQILHRRSLLDESIHLLGHTEFSFGFKVLPGQLLLYACVRLNGAFVALVLGFSAIVADFFEDFVLVCFRSRAVRSNCKSSEAGLFITICLLGYGSAKRFSAKHTIPNRRRGGRREGWERDRYVPLPRCCFSCVCVNRHVISGS